jgi:hypothetical protein
MGIQSRLRHAVTALNQVLNGATAYVLRRTGPLRCVMDVPHPGQAGVRGTWVVFPPGAGIAGRYRAGNLARSLGLLVVAVHVLAVTQRRSLLVTLSAASQARLTAATGRAAGRDDRHRPNGRGPFDRTAASPAYTIPADQAHSVELSRFTQAKLTAATGIKDARSQEVSDLANALLTTALDMWRRSWTPAGANASYGPVSWTLVDSPGPANPPEKRKPKI